MRKSERRQLVGVGALAVTSVTLVTLLTLRIRSVELGGEDSDARRVDNAVAERDSNRLASERTVGNDAPSTLDPARRSTSSTGDWSWADLGMEPAHVVEFSRAEQDDGVTDTGGSVDGGAVAAQGRESSSAEPPDAGASGTSPEAGVAAPGDSPVTDSEPSADPVECGMVTCAPGQVCCNASCAICAEPGVYCKSDPCEMRFLQTGELCGLQSCSFGSTCCCGTCIAPGQACDPDACATRSGLELTVPCGTMTLCDEGEVCCNPSCGTCVRPGETCGQDVCY